MKEEILTAFSDIVRDQVARKNEVHVKGLGTFKKEHLKQRQEQHANGQVVMVPPRDTVKFIPE